MHNLLQATHTHNQSTPNHPFLVRLYKLIGKRQDIRFVAPTSC